MQTNRSMTKYIGINIGPVIKTLSLARRPRELWSASYLFSFLMEYIVDEADKRGEIIAPKEWNNVVADDNLPVGLYPDRIYIRPNEGVVADDILKPACDRFCKCLGHVVKGKGKVKENAKFNILPEIKLVENNGLQSNELKMAEMVIEENKELIAEKWNEFFNKNKKTEVL